MMTLSIHPDKITIAVYDAQSRGLIRCPHGDSLTFPPGRNVTERSWASYPWNRRPGLQADTNASPKPTWQWITGMVRKWELEEESGLSNLLEMTLSDAETAAAPASLGIVRDEYLGKLRHECRKRISAVYGAEDAQDELFIRMRDGADATKDAERDRLRARYAKIKTWAMGVTAKSGFDAVNLSADATWTTTWTPPASAGRE